MLTWEIVQRTGRWDTKGTWRCHICEAAVTSADMAAVVKHASTHDLERWCAALDQAEGVVGETQVVAREIFRAG